MTLSSRDILETWMSAFMDGELDFESSTALLEGLQNDADLRQDMLQFFCVITKKSNTLCKPRVLFCQAKSRLT